MVALLLLFFLWPASAFALGNILIERQGELAGSGIASAPYGTTTVGSQTASASNPNTYTNLSVGQHLVKTKDVLGLVETYGTCTYVIAGSECTVSSWPNATSCDRTWCLADIAVTDGNVTKISFKYSGVYEGYGSSATGGKAGSICTVSNTNDSGAGSLRTCVGATNRYVVFSTSGTITLTSTLCIENPNITIDGFTSQNGIVVVGKTTLITKRHCSTNNGDNVIIRGMTFAPVNSAADDSWWALGITGAGSHTNPVSNVVIDHNAICCSYDDTFTMTDVDLITASYNIISDVQEAGSGGGNAIIQRGRRISWHHNFIGLGTDGLGRPRYPLIAWHNDSESSTGPSDISADFRNNLNHLGEDYGMWVWNGSKVNIVKNYFVGASYVSTTEMNITLQICGSSGAPSGCSFATDPNAEIAYVDGNTYHPTPTNNLDSTQEVSGGPISASAITEQTPLEAACSIIAEAGPRPLRTADQNKLTAVLTDLQTYDTCAVPPVRRRTVTISSPLDGSTVPRKSNVTIEANWDQEPPPITNVTYTVNDQTLQCGPLVMFCNWLVPNPPNRDYTITALVVDEDNNTGMDQIKVRSIRQ